MKRNNPMKLAKGGSAGDNPLRLRPRQEFAKAQAPLLHVFGKGIVCRTEQIGQKTPRGRSPREIVVDASAGFIPLWEKGVTLRWRFQEQSMLVFADPVAARREIRDLFGEALLEWGDAAPVRFAERDDLWDFEIVPQADDHCDANGCTLAAAFFPDAGRHELLVYPKLFEQTRKEQVETLVHEVGHIFGLRHFFANVSEAAWPSEIFGKHDRFSIMNYGADSVLTSADKEDLKRLYRSVWDGTLPEINGTPIRLVRPFSETGNAP